MTSQRSKTPDQIIEHPGDVERCPICAEPFKAGDICATDIELMTCHAACLEGAPVVYLDTGELSEGPVDTFLFEPDGEAPRAD